MSKDDDRSFSYFAKFDLYMSLLNELLTYPPGDAKQTTAHEGLLAKRLCAIVCSALCLMYLNNQRPGSWQSTRNNHIFWIRIWRK